MNKNTILIITIGSLSTLCCAMQSWQPYTSMQPQMGIQMANQALQRTDANIANIQQMHGHVVPQQTLNNLKGVDYVIAQRHNEKLAQQQLLQRK